MTKVILIRHGQTNWNLRKKYCGFTDLCLNMRGKKQAEKLRLRLKNELVHKVYSSDRRRAFQTAKIIFKGAGIEKVGDLREMSFGIFEGLSYKEILRKHPLLYKKWLKRPFNVTIPNGENPLDFKKRIMRAFRKITLHNKGKTVAVVCHGGTISVILNHSLKSNDFWKRIPASASLNIIEYKNSKVKIKLFNDTSHLPR
jgi:broad specificity phosphatase PhoE